MNKRLENIFAVCALLFFAGAFIPLFTQQSQQLPDDKPQSVSMALIQRQVSSANSDPAQANRVMLIGQILIYGGVAGLLFVYRRQAWCYFRDTKLLWAIIALAYVSVLWSDVPGFAFRRCVNVTATSAFGLYLASRYSTRQLLRLLGWTFAIAIVCSAIVALLRPDLGVDSAMTNFAWKGIFVQKNTLARLMSLGALVFLFLAFDDEAHRRRYVILSIICVGMIFAARSATSALVVPLVLAVIWLFALARQRSGSLVFVSASVAIIGTLCGTMLFIEPSDLFGLVGRDATMSGRLEIWDAVIPKIMEHPWLGYGYGSFWLGMGGQASADLWSILGWPVPHSHNGFLDLVEELGFVGLGVFLAGFVLSARRGLIWARSQQSLIALWPLAYITFMFLFNLTEGSILRQDNLFWVLYVATTVFVVHETNQLVTEVPQAQLGGDETPLSSQYAPLGSAKESMGLRWS